ncbi:MAG: cobyrinate a,c-diamide synthase [Proteobacteria bacterium]|nr:cobyrinate a,c-diamide synthase [Pseudomonadota bacterium]
MVPGLVISAPASGTGKTTLTLGLLAAWRAAGVRVHPFKNGPDYIDPAFHKAASGVASVNLDSWAMPPALLEALAGEAQGADLILSEGSMGLFDGVVRPGASGMGASAELSKRFGWPVVLVLDVSGQAQSAAAIAHGFKTLDPALPFAGVILNKVASPRHEALVRAGMEGAGIRVFGALPKREAIALPSRHLGLVQAEERTDLPELLEDLAAFVVSHVDLPALRHAAGGCARPDAKAYPIIPPGQRIALARDAAFSFVYPHLMQGWRAAGAEILPFSALNDEAPDASADVCWLPGGYPELHAGRLAGNARFLGGLRRFAEAHPVHGECGGYMALGEALIDASGARHAMAGLLGLVTSFAKRKMHLGYRRATLAVPMPGFGAGTRLRGHEFHYASILEAPDSPLAEVVDASGELLSECGSVRGKVTGTFFHLVAVD